MGRPIVGFHATTPEKARAILSTKKYTSSMSEFNWLGKGVYFWENDLQRAIEWGCNLYTPANTAVIKQTLKLGRCLDLTQRKWLECLKKTYLEVVKEFEKKGEKTPVNRGSDRQLNSLLLERAKASYGSNFDTVRCAFSDGDEIGKGSGIFLRSHIQVVVLNEEVLVRAPKLEVEQPLV